MMTKQEYWLLAHKQIPERREGQRKMIVTGMRTAKDFPRTIQRESIGKGRESMEWKEKLHKSAHHAGNDIKAFVKWTACACVVGTVMGGVGTLFHLCMEFANDARNSNAWLLWLLPLGGAAIALMYKLCGMEQDQGTNLVITSVRSTEQISIKTAPLIFISTFLTHLFGGSSGREGAALQMGGASLPKWDAGCVWTKRTSALSSCAG